MDSAAYAAMRGLVRGLVEARVINSHEQVGTIITEILSEADHYREIGHIDKFDAIVRLSDQIRKDGEDLV